MFLQKLVSDNEVVIQRLNLELSSLSQSSDREIKQHIETIKLQEDQSIEYKKQIRMLEERLSECESEESQHRLKERNQIEELNSKTAEISFLKNNIANLNDNMAALQNNLDEKICEITILKSRNKEYTDTKETLEKRITQLIERDSSLSSENSRILNSMSQHQDNAKQLNEVMILRFRT